MEEVLSRLDVLVSKGAIDILRAVQGGTKALRVPLGGEKGRAAQTGGLTSTSPPHLLWR